MHAQRLFQTERLSFVPINRFSRHCSARTKLFVDELPLVTSHDIAAGIVELDELFETDPVH